jgi:hypothetical protein
VVGGLVVVVGMVGRWDKGGLPLVFRNTGLWVEG